MELQLGFGDDRHRLRRESGGEITLFDGSDGEPRRFRVTRVTHGGFLVETASGTVFADAVRHRETVWVHFHGRTYRLAVSSGRPSRGGGRAAGNLASPMPGQVQKLLASVGAEVAAGEPLLVVEAMKMQLEIKAPHAGTVTRFLAVEGEQVEAGMPLVEVEETS